MSRSSVINISGMLMSSLLYEHVNTDCDQDGFLLGEVVTYESQSVTDKWLSEKKEETLINIHGFIPCDAKFSFYNNCGIIQEDKMLFFLKDREKDVIGWYSYRRNSDVKASLRETAVHKNLQMHFPNNSKFIFAVFIARITMNMATHHFEHKFYQALATAGDGISFDGIAVNIINLGDTSSHEYRIRPEAPVNFCNGALSEIMTSLGDFMERMESSNIAQGINLAVMNRLETVMDQVGGSEAEIGSVSLEIQELEAKLQSYISQTAAPEEKDEKPEVQVSENVAPVEKVTPVEKVIPVEKVEPVFSPKPSTSAQSAEKIVEQHPDVCAALIAACSGSGDGDPGNDSGNGDPGNDSGEDSTPLQEGCARARYCDSIMKKKNLEGS